MKLCRGFVSSLGLLVVVIGACGGSSSQKIDLPALASVQRLGGHVEAGFLLPAGTFPFFYALDDRGNSYRGSTDRAGAWLPVPFVRMVRIAMPEAAPLASFVVRGTDGAGQVYEKTLSTSTVQFDPLRAYSAMRLDAHTVGQWIQIGKAGSIRFLGGFESSDKTSIQNKRVNHFIDVDVRNDDYNPVVLRLTSFAVQERDGTIRTEDPFLIVSGERGFEFVGQEEKRIRMYFRQTNPNTAAVFVSFMMGRPEARVFGRAIIKDGSAFKIEERETGFFLPFVGDFTPESIDAWPRG